MRAVLGLALAAIVAFTVELPAQKDSKTAQTSPLVLTGAIPLENVHGRIDHFGFDPKNRLFVSALGNNTEEVIDLSAQRVVHTISGVPAPQGSGICIATSSSRVNSLVTVTPMPSRQRSVERPQTCSSSLGRDAVTRTSESNGKRGLRRCSGWRSLVLEPNMAIARRDSVAPITLRPFV